MFIPYVINSPAAVIEFRGHLSKLSVLRTPHLIPADILKDSRMSCISHQIYLSPVLPEVETNIHHCKKCGILTKGEG